MTGNAFWLGAAFGAVAVAVPAMVYLWGLIGRYDRHILNLEKENSRLRRHLDRVAAGRTVRPAVGEAQRRKGRR